MLPGCPSQPSPLFCPEISAAQISGNALRVLDTWRASAPPAARPEMSAAGAVLSLSLGLFSLFFLYFFLSFFFFLFFFFFFFSLFFPALRFPVTSKAGITVLVEEF